MRIKEEYKKSGYFWFPENESKKLPGTLFISDGGKAELEVIGLFDVSNKILGRNSGLKRIIGHVEKDGLVTLEECFFKNGSLTIGGISKTLLRVTKVLCGVAYEKDETIKFNTISFSVEGLNEWLEISGIDVSYSKDLSSATIRYTPLEKITYNISNGFTLNVCFAYTLPGLPSTNQAMITQQAYFKLSSAVEKELSEFINTLYQITHMMCFAIDKTVCIFDVIATSNKIVKEISISEKKPAPVKIYYQSLPFTPQTPQISSNLMFFSYFQIQERAENIFNNWLNAYSTIKPALDLYFSAMTGEHKYIDGKFLALAQCFETYHRRTSSETIMEDTEFRKIVETLLSSAPEEHREWLNGRLSRGNEINLGQRIKKIIEPYKVYIGNCKERNMLIRDIVNTRNYLTHYSKELQGEHANGYNLYYLARIMEAIFQLHLLQILGFSKQEIDIIVTNNYKFKNKFNEYKLSKQS